LTPAANKHGTVEASATFRILVVDDEELARRMMTRAIGAAGHFCASTGSGEEAIELLEIQQFHLAVVDKNLPDVSGIEVARRALGLSRQVPVIMVTGFPSDESEREAQRIGAARYIVKPFETSELQQEVREVLRASWGPSPPPSSEADASKPPSARETTPLRGSTADTAHREPDAPRAAEGPADTDVAVLLVEPDRSVRGALIAALTAAGCRVVAFQSQQQAEVHVRYVGYDVLVARPELLSTTGHWSSLVPGSEPLGVIAIAGSDALAERVSAIQNGVQGVLAPPFEKSMVVAELLSALAVMRDRRDADVDSSS
jgi:DNA-binding response OmpR family regulator